MTQADVNTALGICGKGSSLPSKYGSAVERLVIEGYEVSCGFFPARYPSFDPGGNERHSVLLATTAFSCNYRDKALILRMANMPLESSFYPIGSELSGTVVEVGTAVDNLKVGDRVMIDGYYASGEQPWGIPTNHASRRFQVIRGSKLKRVPETMTDLEAASFSIGGQTSFSMVRRAGVVDGTQVLVTGGSSNTSLFLMMAARYAGGRVSVTTTTAGKADMLLSLGADRVFVVDPQGDGLHKDEVIREYVKDTGGFDVVLDPFADLYLAQSIHVMAVGGRYISCGVERQFPPADREVTMPSERPLLDEMGFLTVMTRNLQIIGNCIGTTEDLDNALAAWENGQLPVSIDSVFGPGNTNAASPGGAADFLSRTYLERDRIGKVVYRYP